MFVGQTEAKIAAMFREAASERGVLLLDEADSFLRSRQGAVRSWELTQVNELLKQMEDYDGIFICATNLIDQLDEAALRRFDLKVEYRYLTAVQARELFFATLARRDLASDAVLARLARLHNLTPGDFATVVRKAAILGEPLKAEALITGLEAECAAKPDGRRRPIGFAG
jgi:SpoVK/Ycf46/Vps4 family AAA+-type ATPase